MKFAILLCMAGMALASSNKGRIVGGSQVNQLGELPFMAVVNFDNRFICSGSIITSRHILTAAHCVFTNGTQDPTNKFQVRLGSLDATAVNSGILMSVEAIFPHPGYDDLGETYHDMAILRLSNEITFSSNVNKINLGSSIDATAGKRVTYAGYGNSDLAGTQYGPLKKGSSWITDEIVCSLLYPLSPIGPDKLCAGGLLQPGICNGDSGGPAWIIKNGVNYQVGISSFISGLTGCGTLPGVFTNVPYHKDWIDSTLTLA